MDLLVVVYLLFYITITNAKDFLRTGRGDDIRIPDNSAEKDPSKVVALLILEHNDSSEETEDSNYDANGLKVWTGPSDSTETDSSGDTNSDEYEDSRSYDTDSESNFYHVEDYDPDDPDDTDVSTFVESQPILRKAWRSCLKKAAKTCKKACTATYKTACDTGPCKSKFKRTMKKGCKRNCKDFFNN